MTRNQSIDLIKIIAMLGVISLHSNMGRTDMFLTAFVLSRTAGISIPLFFMVSGYLMLDRKTDWKYSVYKIIQIIRFVFIIVFCHWIFTMWFSEYSFYDMLRTFAGSFIQHGRFFVFWYFGAMCIIYMILPLLQKICQHKNLWIYFIGFCGIICFIFFELDAECSFEKNYISQTFRVWYWLFFFMTGGIIKRMELANIFNTKLLPFALVLAGLAFLAFVYWFKYKINEIEYFFGSVPCWIYAFMTFMFVVSKNVKSKHIVTLSKVFLPCYALHMIVIRCWHKLIITNFWGMWSPIVDYFIVVFFTIGISSLIMRTPIIKNVFKF